MIYTVECRFSDPAGEAAWNDFYSLEKLPALITVPGVHTSQRFKSLNHHCPDYLALHTVDGPQVLTSEAYCQKGGGNFAAWQQHITAWRRNLYRDIQLAPAVNADELLVLCAEGAEPLMQMGLKPRAMQAVALDKLPPRRWLATLPRPRAALAENLPAGVYLYTPITEQLTSACCIATEQGE